MSKKPLVIIVIILFAITPVIWFNYLPLIDYPDHLATMQIRNTIHSNINLARFYEFRWILTPYLGLDLLATPFLPLFSVETVGKIVIALTFVLICVATILLDRQLNQNNWGLSVFAGIFLYNGAFNWGWMNYIIGIGFAIVAFWIWVRYREKSVGISIVLFTFLGGIVCLMHFFAFVVYGVCVAGYECSIFLENLRVELRLRMSLFRIPFRAAVSLIVPLLAILSRTPSNHGQTVWGRSWGPQTFWVSFVEWKGEALVSPLYFHHFSEKLLLVAMVAILVWALATRTLVVNLRMLIPLAAFGVICVVMPTELLGWFGPDYRLPSGVAFFALASFGWGEASPARINVVCLLLGFCLILRVASVFSNWQRAQPIIAEYDTALQLVPPGSRLEFIVGDGGWSNPPLVHVPVLPAVKRGVYVPNINYGELGLVKKRDPVPSSIKDFDYLLEIRDPYFEIPAGISLKEVGRGQTFTLYRIDQGTAK